MCLMHVYDMFAVLLHFTSGDTGYITDVSVMTRYEPLVWLETVFAVSDHVVLHRLGS